MGFRVVRAGDRECFLRSMREVGSTVFPFGLPLTGGLARACLQARPGPCATMLSALQCHVLVLALKLALKCHACKH